VDVDQLDRASQRLLPLLYWNLRNQGIEDSLMDRCRAAYVVTGLKNERVFGVMADLLRSLQQAGIRTLVLKGAALTVLHYQDHGLRPMVDFDVLVPTTQATEAVGLLTELGWRQSLGPLEAFNEAYYSMVHGRAFQNPLGGNLDLHWHVLADCCYPGADDDFWAGAVPLTIADVSSLALNPTDQLLHTCMHGRNRSRVPSVRWIADALVVLRSTHAEVDWDRLVAQAERRRLILGLSEMLGYLHDTWHAPVPKRVIQSLGNLPVSRTERLEYWWRGRPPGVTGGLMGAWFRHLRSHQGADGGALRPSADLVGLTRRFQVVWQLQHPWQVPGAALARGARRVKRWIAGQSQISIEDAG
jgi:hypothetical protein